MHNQFIPAELRESLERYAISHVPTGGFLAAVLSNDLFEAVGRADETNIRFIGPICQFVYSHLPAASWGSREKVEEWTSRRVVESAVMVEQFAEGA